MVPDVELESLLESLSPEKSEIKRLIVTSPKYFEEMSKILSDTSKEVIQAYINWKVIQFFVPDVKADELKPYERFRNELLGRVS